MNGSVSHRLGFSARNRFRATVQPLELLSAFRVVGTCNSVSNR